MRRRHVIAIKHVVAAFLTITILMIITGILEANFHFKFFGITWTTIGYLITILLTMAILVSLWTKNVVEKDGEQHMKKQSKPVSFEDLGIEEEETNTNIVGNINPFEPDKTMQENYDFATQEPEEYIDDFSEIDVPNNQIRKAQPHYSQQPVQQPQRLMQQPQRQMQQPQTQIRQQQVQQQRIVPQQQNNILEQEEQDEKEVARLLTKAKLHKQQLTLIKQKLALFGIQIQ